MVLKMAARSTSSTESDDSLSANLKTVESAKKAKARCKVFIGDNLAQWTLIKTENRLNTNPQVAKFLIDWYYATHSNADENGDNSLSEMSRVKGNRRGQKPHDVDKEERLDEEDLPEGKRRKPIKSYTCIPCNYTDTKKHNWYRHVDSFRHRRVISRLRSVTLCETRERTRSRSPIERDQSPRLDNSSNKSVNKLMHPSPIRQLKLAPSNQKRLSKTVMSDHDDLESNLQVHFSCVPTKHEKATQCNFRMVKEVVSTETSKDGVTERRDVTFMSWVPFNDYKNNTGESSRYSLPTDHDR